MDIFPVVCALLSFLLTGPSEAKVVTLELGSAVKGERWNFNATCKGTCKGVWANVTALFGFPLVYGKKGSLPQPDDCKDCFCSEKDVCGNISFQSSSSFAISVVPYTTIIRHATLTVEALNLDKITNITLPSKRVNLGSSQRGKRRNFKVTCYGKCEQVSAFVTASSGGFPFLYGAENSMPRLDDDKRCKDCFCESVTPWRLNICQYKSLEHSTSFTLSVTAETAYENAFLHVEAINFKWMEEIVSPPQILKLSSHRVGHRSNFYITCDGPCRGVHVEAVSGNPQLHLAKSSIPFLQRSGCKNCLETVNDYTFKDSSSFGLTVPTTKSGDVVKVEAANLKDIREIIYPSKTFDIGRIVAGERWTVNLTCNGPCKEFRVYAKHDHKFGEAFWYVSKQTIDNPSSYSTCKNCICDKVRSKKSTCDFRSVDDISTFFFLLKAYTIFDLGNTKVFFEGFNLNV